MSLPPTRLAGGADVRWRTVRDRLVLFTIGFVKLTVTDGVRDGSCAGSGTLVDVDGVLGTLTAAHLPNAF